MKTNRSSKGLCRHFHPHYKRHIFVKENLSNSGPVVTTIANVKRLSLIARLNVVLNRTVVVDSD